jgi:ATP-dependent Clp protease ATP-binding subunit ClpC
MTSNVGTKDIKDISSFGFGEANQKDNYNKMKNTVEDAMKKLFNPEFLNRIDDAIVFRNLNKEDIMQIINIEIKDLYKNLEENKMDLVLDQSAKEFLVDKGFDEKFGARPLRRAIQKYVEDPLAEEILRKSFKDNARIIAKHVEGTEDLVFYDEAAEITNPGAETKTPGQVEN